MEVAVFITLSLVIAIAVIIYYKIQHIKNLKAQIHASFGSIPQEEDPDFDRLSSIKQYAEHITFHDMRIDSITWNDLDMDRVFKRINACQSSVGEEYLYNCLHEPHFEEEILLKREELIKFFDSHPKERFAAQYALAKLGKENYNGIATLIFGADIKLLRHPYIYKILALLPLVSIAGFIFGIAAGIFSILVAFTINLVVDNRAMKKVNIEIPAIAYFAAMMRCCKRLYKIKPLCIQPIMSDLQKPYKAFKKAVSKAPTKKPNFSSDMADAMWAYFNTMFLYNVRHYNNFMSLIMRHNQEFHHIFKTLGEIDLAISILSFRMSLPAFSTPKFCDKNVLDFKDIYHPLIPKPVTNTYLIDRNSLITGSNASGKSTFIKTLAINGILAQTIFTCTAKHFETRFSMIITSMAMRDDLLGGESYFIVEIKSLKRILDLVEKYPCTCYIDEILRGTNTIERIAASASILNHLSKKDCLCIAASHDIELTRITDYSNYHFREHVTDGTIMFDYLLKTGPSTTKNAIKLLEVMGFDQTIVENAQELAL